MQGWLFARKGSVDSETPLARLWRCGCYSLCDAELVSMLVRPGCSEGAAREMAHRVLGSSGLAGLLRLETKSFLSQRGLARRQAAAVLAAVELGRRLARLRIPPRKLLERRDRVADYLSLRYHNCDQEVVGALYLDVHHRLIDEEEIYRGALCRTAVEPRGILKGALSRSASSFILFHTHPSGDPAPSAEDLLFTRRLSAAGELLGVHLVDHLILGEGRWVSLESRGG